MNAKEEGKKKGGGVRNHSLIAIFQRRESRNESINQTTHLRWQIIQHATHRHHHLPISRYAEAPSNLQFTCMPRRKFSVFGCDVAINNMLTMQADQRVQHHTSNFGVQLQKTIPISKANMTQDTTYPVPANSSIKKILFSSTRLLFYFGGSVFAFMKGENVLKGLDLNVLGFAHTWQRR